MQRIILALAVVVAGVLYVEPVIKQSSHSMSARTTVAQRYPLRSRSKNFYERSKISYTKARR